MQNLTATSWRHGTSSRPVRGPGTGRAAWWSMRVLGFGLCTVLAACSSASPDPVAMARDLPPEREIDAATATDIARRTEVGLALLAEGRHDEARLAAQRAIDLDPRAARALAIRARAATEAARAEEPPSLRVWRRIEGEFLQASVLAPDDPVVGLLHAQFLLADGHLNAAAERLDQVLEQVPADLAALQLAAEVRYDLGDEGQALALLLRYLELRPDDATAAYRLAQCYSRLAPVEIEPDVQTARHRSAAAAFARYRELAPTDPDGFLGEAHARFEVLVAKPTAKPTAEPTAEPAAEPADSGEVAAVLALYDKAAELASGSPAPEFGRGVVLEYLGRVQDAREAYMRALERDAGHLPSLLNLAASLAESGAASEARSYLDRALQLDLPEDERRRIDRYLAANGANGAAVSGAGDWDKVLGREWRLALIDGTDLAPDSSITLKLDPDGRFAGNGGVNGYSGSYEHDGASLSAAELTHTEMAGDDPQKLRQEERYFGMLRALASWRLHEDELELRTTDGALMAFR